MLDTESIHRLEGLIGETWKGFGGASMGADLFQPFTVLLSTTHHELAVNSAVEFFDIMGEQYETAIAELNVSAGNQALKRAADNGHMFLHNAGEKVVDVLIIRDTVDEVRDGEHTWRVTKDVGIVIALGRGAIAVTQDDLHDEMLAVSVGDAVDSLELPSVASRWQDKLGIEYTRSRVLISVRSLSGERGSAATSTIA